MRRPAKLSPATLSLAEPRVILSRRAALLGVASWGVGALFLTACQGARLKGGWETVPGATPPPAASTPAGSTPVTAPVPRFNDAPARRPVSDRPLQQYTYPGPRAARPRRGQVNLRTADLAGIDKWLSTENKQWVLGDVVDVYASKEYFATVLTLNAKVGTVQRKDQKIGGDHLVVMRFIGHRGSASAMTNPRVQIGPGLMVTARKVLRVRMAKTKDARRPAQLRVVAHGEAAQGRGDDTLRRADQIELGGSLAYRRDRWVWAPYSR